VNGGDVAALVALLASRVPATPREVASLTTIRAYLAWLPAPFDEGADPVHVTGSAIVLASDGRTVLHRHKRLGLWLQPGGHLDPGESPADAALREAVEETGLPLRHPDTGPRLIHVDVHEGGRGHLHLDLRYLLWAGAGDAFAPGAGESQDLGWFTAEEVAGRGDASVTDAVRAALAVTTPRRDPR
jgi:8-oxo-dGTP pyrophosphatase MutT (NUDIX family)